MPSSSSISLMPSEGVGFTSRTSAQRMRMSFTVSSGLRTSHSGSKLQTVAGDNPYYSTLNSFLDYERKALADRTADKQALTLQVQQKREALEILKQENEISLKKVNMLSEECELNAQRL